MKFRCTTNSIRLRVRKSDLEILERQGEICEQVVFGPGEVMKIALRTGDKAHMHAAFSGGMLCVEVPHSAAISWIASSEVSMEAIQETGQAGQGLHILVEKDFPCRHTTEANRQDTFYELAPDDPAVC